MSTQQNSLITVSVDGKPLGTFDGRTGGVTAADPGKTRPGGMQQEKLWGALPSTDDVTVTRVYERERDIALAADLRTKCGNATIAISEQPLDAMAVPFGKPTTWTGLLMSVDTGESNSSSGDARILTLVARIGQVA